MADHSVEIRIILGILSANITIERRDVTRFYNTTIYRDYFNNNFPKDRDFFSCATRGARSNRLYEPLPMDYVSDSSTGGRFAALMYYVYLYVRHLHAREPGPVKPVFRSVPGSWFPVPVPPHAKLSRQSSSERHTLLRRRDTILSDDAILQRL